MENLDVLKAHNVDVTAALSFWGDTESYNESLKEYKDALSDKLDNLEQYLKNEDWENYAILAHSLKSEAKYLGFMKDAEVFLDHELKGKEKDGQYLNNNFQVLKNTVYNIDSVLSKYFGESVNFKKKVLIADDSNIMINYIEKNISNEYEVIKANNGNEAIEKIGSVKDLYAILLDLNMPSLNGFQVLDYLKDNDLIEKIPVVIITGDDTEETIKKAFTYPILDVLNKPFNESKIKRVLYSIDSFYDKK